MIPILYDKNETVFTHNGVGLLAEATKATVTEERNGSYELSLQYPITGRFYSEITEGAIIKAKANETSAPQLFRIYKSSKPINGIVTYSAEHISYDLNGIPLLGFSVKNATPQMALTKAIEGAALPCPFTAYSDISTLNSTEILTPCSVRALLGGQTGSLLDVWGGEYEFDNFTVKLHLHRGKNNGVVIEYGKNLKDLKQERNIAECYTHLMPYAVYTVQDESGNSEEKYVYLAEKVIPLTEAEDIGHYKAFIMDFSDRFGDNEEITEDKLRAKATAYAAAVDLGIPKVNITVSFVQLWQTEEYKNIAPLERVKLCDTVTVRFSKLGVAATSKVIKTVYDPLQEKYESVTLGDAKSSFANTVNKQQEAIKDIKASVKKGQAEATEQLKKAIANATSLITGHSGGYVVLNPAEKPQEILILDAPTIDEAVNVWRWNSGGLGYSSTGYNGEYSLAMTMDGAIVADFVKAGELNGNLIKAHSIQADAITADVFRIIFNTVSDYVMFEDGQLKIIDNLDNEKVVLGKNGLEVFGGDITVYSGADRSSPKSIYLDENGNVSYAGYITQPGSSTKAIVGKNVYGNPGFFVYQFKDEYKKSDGTYKPYMEFWSSANNYSVITGVNQLRFAVDDMSDNKNIALACSTSGGTLFGAWDFSQDQIFSHMVGTTSHFSLYSDTTKIGSLYASADKRIVVKSENGAGLLLSCGDTVRVSLNTDNNSLYGIWSIGTYNLRNGTTIRVDSTDVGGIWWDNNDCIVTNANSGWKWGVSVGNSYRIQATSSGVTLWGNVEFKQDQFFNVNIGSAFGFVLQNGGTRYGSFYVSSSKCPCFNSDTGADFNFAVNGSTKLSLTNSGGQLYGTWYGTSSQAIPSDINRKNTVEKLPASYSAFFDMLKPKRYKYNDGTSNRFHTGLIAQEVEQALAAAEIDTSDFAGFIKTSENGCYLRYEEFISLCINEIQNLKKQITALEAQKEEQ